MFNSIYVLPLNNAYKSYNQYITILALLWQNEAMSENNNKKIKGSAIVGEEGEFIFTPYKVCTDDEKSMKMVAVFGILVLWKTKMRIPSGSKYHLKAFRICQKSQLTSFSASLTSKKTPKRLKKQPKRMEMEPKRS